MKRMHKLMIILLALMVSAPVFAEAVSKEQIKGLDEQVQEIKKDVLAISSELSLLEEKLLYPSNTQVSLFVSIVKGSKYNLDAVQIKVDGKDVAHYIYSFKEVEAMHRGGVQRVYTGNIRTGAHKLEVAVIGKNDGGSKNTSKATYTINKEVGPKLVEIRLGSGSSLIDFRDW